MYSSRSWVCTLIKFSRTTTTKPPSRSRTLNQSLEWVSERASRTISNGRATDSKTKETKWGSKRKAQSFPASTLKASHREDLKRTCTRKSVKDLATRKTKVLSWQIKIWGRTSGMTNPASRIKTMARCIKVSRQLSQQRVSAISVAQELTLVRNLWLNPSSFKRTFRRD